MHNWKSIVFVILAIGCSSRQNILPNNELKDPTPRELNRPATPPPQSSDLNNTESKPKVERISRFRLDDRSFSVLKLAIGQQLFLESQSPVVAYKIPDVADYVEILRCQTNVILNAGTDTIKLTDIELSKFTPEQRDSFYRNNNFFAEAERQEECELVSTGTFREEFLDSWAPSGKYRWLVRACVSPNRLLDKEKLSTRNCSRRVAISSALQVSNNRKKKENSFLRKANQYSLEMEQIAQKMVWMGKEFNYALQFCEDFHHGEEIRKKKKEAIIILIATAIEVPLELATAGRAVVDGKPVSFLKHYTNPKEIMDILQLMGALGGMTFVPILQALTFTSEDVPRTCPKTLNIEQQLAAATQELLIAGLRYGYYADRADIARKGQNALDPSESSPGF